jgi:peptide/nickel transport system permease protein
MADNSKKLAGPEAAMGAKSPRRYSEGKRIMSVLFSRKLAFIGLIIIGILMIMAIFAPLIAPYDPYTLNLLNKLQPPSLAHWLGTDSLGRDTLSRIIYGARTSMVVGLVSVTTSSVVGLTLGTVAGYFGGKLEMVIMRIMDCLMALPMILLALLVASLLGGGIKNVIIALSFGMIAGPTRLADGMTMTIKQNEYVLAARAMGAGDIRMMVGHILPNVFPTLIVAITIGLGAVILAEAGLSFLGIGITPPTPTWGGMINEGYKFLLSNPVLAVSPGIAIMLAVFGFNMLGDGLRDALDPRLRGTI